MLPFSLTRVRLRLSHIPRKRLLDAVRPMMTCRYPTALRLTHLTGMPADGRIALRPDAAAAAGAGVRCLLPLEFQVAVDSADGVPLRREELGPLQLAYACRQVCRRVDVGTGSHA